MSAVTSSKDRKALPPAPQEGKRGASGGSGPSVASSSPAPAPAPQAAVPAAAQASVQVPAASDADPGKRIIAAPPGPKRATRASTGAPIALTAKGSLYKANKDTGEREAVFGCVWWWQDP